MKKIFAVLSCAALAVSAASALDISVGAGGLFEAGLGGGVKGHEIEGVNIGGGGFLFFDASYVEIGLGFSGGSFGQDPDKPRYTSLHVSVLGKYPIDLDPVILFPLLGIDYQIMLGLYDNHKEMGGHYASDKSALALKLGFGVDYFFSTSFFLRSEILYGLRLPNKDDKALMDTTAAAYHPGHGPTIKVAVGYWF
jgi:hypothetical protein